MQVTVLGKSPSWQDVDGACSGYLVTEGTTTLLLDCGNGVFGQLRKVVDYVDVDAVAVSHMHADHCIDLFPYAYALTYTPRQQPVPVAGHPGTAFPACPRLIAPPGGREVFRRIAEVWGNDELIENAFKLEEYDPDGSVDVGPLRLRFQAMPHFMPTFAVEIVSQTDGGKRFTFSADCAPNEEIVEFARDTDLLLIEATLPRPERAGPRGHLTPAEAGEHARRAGAKRVVLTHISDELDEDWARDEGRQAFGSDAVEVARIGAVYDV